MIVFVRYNLGAAVAVELQDDSSVSELKQLVGRQQGVGPEHLRVLFAGRELQGDDTLQGCNVPEQSTVHVVLPPSSPRPVLLQERLVRGWMGGHNSLTKLDLNSTRRCAPSSGLAVVLEQEGRNEEKVTADRRSCSSFYVFCKSCSSLQPGKLRVRCRVCKHPTFTISRDPSHWDDVLLPARIHGICQSQGCLGNEAEFYMKCASHPTSDDSLSVALDLIMTNIRDVPCIACTDVMDVVLVFQCAERHVICLDCFRRYCQTRLNDRQFVHHPVIGYSLPCAAGCADSLIKELHHFQVLGDEQYQRYQQYGAEHCLLAIGGVICPSPGCGAGLLPPEGSRRVECDPQLGCGFVFCRNCSSQYHQGPCLTSLALSATEGVQEFVVDQEASVRGRWDQASLRYIQETTKRCPQCSVPVERNGGCMHMQCVVCRVEWCWLCCVIWNRDCMSNHWFG